jgi:hypothetical protein
MYPFYVLLGKLAHLLGLPALPVFSAAAGLALPGLVFAGYAFAAVFTETVATRRTAVVLLMLGSGLGIWAAAVMAPGPAAGSSTPALSYDRAEVSSYLLPFGPPHLTLALALLLLWGRSLVTWIWAGKPRSLIALIATVVLIGLLNSFTLATLVALASGYALLRWALSRAFPPREVAAALAVGLAAAPVLVVSFLLFTLDPFWGTAYGSQNTTGSPPPWVLGMDFGLLLPMALVGAVWSEERRESRAALALWVLALLALMYLPVSFQRRFGFGLQPAVAVLAAMGLVHVERLLARRRPVGARPRLPLLRMGFRTLVLTGVFSGTMLGYVLLLMAAGGGGPLGETIFEPAGNARAAEWLATHSGAGDVVLSSVETGNYLAGKIPGRVVVGHGAGTLDFPAKKTLMKEFFDPAASGGERLRLVQQGRVTMVFVGKRERALGVGALGPDEGFDLVYDSQGVQIYRPGEGAP